MAQYASQPASDESIFRAECLVVAMFEVLKPAPQRPVHVRDGLGHAIPEVRLVFARMVSLNFLRLLLRGERLPAYSALQSNRKAAELARGEN
jgi:hypothetical protein